MKIENRPVEDLKQIARDIHNNLIFIDRYIRDPKDLQMVFMPIIFLEEDKHLELINAKLLRKMRLGGE